MSTRTFLLPSILVGAGIHRSGGVTYYRRTLEERDDGPSSMKKWETTKEVADAEELRKAENLAGSLRRKLRKVCADTRFGLVCTEAREAELDQILAEIRLEAREASRDLTTCTLRVSFIKGKVSSNDRDAAAALVGEVNTFLAGLTKAIGEADYKTIRALLQDAKGLDELMVPSEGEILRQAIEAARQAATTIKKGIEKEGRQREFVVRGLDVAAINTARFAFLEFEPAEPAVTSSVSPNRFALAVNE